MAIPSELAWGYTERQMAKYGDFLTIKNFSLILRNKAPPLSIAFSSHQHGLHGCALASSSVCAEGGERHQGVLPGRCPL